MTFLNQYTLKINPFIIGLLISFLGALPLGYINIISLQILLSQGNWATTSFISGIVFVQFFVLKTVSFGANWLVKQRKLLLFIDVFTIIFFAGISIYFITNIGNDKNFSINQLQLAKFPFILGLLLNSLNFIQWPYWSGIYIYLFRAKKLKPNCNDNSIFTIGVMLGTSIGMLIFAYVGKHFLVENKIEISKYLNPIFASLFLILTTIQIGKLMKKHRKKVTQITRLENNKTS